MYSALDRQAYSAVANNGENRKPARYPKRCPADQQYNYKPIPLRATFLLTFSAFFAVCIALVEVLLHSTVDTQTSTTASSTLTANTTATPSYHRLRRRDVTTSLRARDVYTQDCRDPQTLTASMASFKALSSSFCNVFTESYQAHTANLSWPMQTEVSQWLVQYESVTGGWITAKNSALWCSGADSNGAWTVSPTGGMGLQGTFPVSVDVLCTISVITVFNTVCTGIGTASIANFALSSTVYPLCGVSSAAVIAETSDDPSTLTSGVPKVNVIDTATPTELVTKPGASVAPADSPMPTLPTVTMPADSGPSLTQASNIVTQPAQAPTASGENTDAPVIVVMAALPVTLLSTNSLGQTQTIVGQASPIAGSSAAVVFTNSQGAVETITTQLAALAESLVTNSQGLVQTLTTRIIDMATIVGTNAQGNPETLIVPSDQLNPSTSTYKTTDVLGVVSTVTTRIYALAGSLSTYLSTNSDGRVQTVVSQLAASTTSESRYTTTTEYTSLVTTTGADGRVSSLSAVVVETVVLTGTPATGTVLATKTSTVASKATNTAGFVLSSHEKIVDHDYNHTIYILAMYLPAVIAVLIKATWEMVFAAIKLRQPFERMCTDLGAEAKYTIFAEYLSSSISWNTFTSLGHGNPLPLLSGFLYIVVQILTPTAGASMTIRARSMCTRDGVPQRCNPVWVLNTSLLRGVEAALALCLVVVLLVLWSMKKSRSGVTSDPSSLAALAGLMNHEALLQDVQQVGTDVDHTSFETALDQHRFLLDYHGTPKGLNAYGIIGNGIDESRPTTKFSELDSRVSSTAYSKNLMRDQHKYQSIHNPASNSYASTSFTSRLRKHLVTDICGLFFPLTLLSLILAFYFGNSDNPLNTFFNSNTWASKFVLTALATLSSLHLSHLERLVRVAEPFRRLSHAAPDLQRRALSKYIFLSMPTTSNVPPETTLLVTRSGTPYSTLPNNIALLTIYEIHGGRMLFQTLVALTVVISDLNILTVSGIAYSDSMTWASYQMSAKTSIAFTAWIVLVYALIILWWRRSHSIQYLGGRSISKGVGTIGGCMRWLVQTPEGMDVIAAIERVREEKEWSRNEKSHAGFQNDEKGAGMTRVWFGKTGAVGANGRQRWSLMCDVPDDRRDSVTSCRESLVSDLEVDRRRSRDVVDVYF